MNEHIVAGPILGWGDRLELTEDWEVALSYAHRKLEKAFGVPGKAHTIRLPKRTVLSVVRMKLDYSPEWREVTMRIEVCPNAHVVRSQLHFRPSQLGTLPFREPGPDAAVEATGAIYDPEDE